MTHEYSVQIHDWISKKIDLINQELKTLTIGADSKKEENLRGKLKELDYLRQYLSVNVDLDTHQYF